MSGEDQNDLSISAIDRNFWVGKTQVKVNDVERAHLDVLRLEDGMNRATQITTLTDQIVNPTTVTTKGTGVSKASTQSVGSQRTNTMAPQLNVPQQNTPALAEDELQGIFALTSVGLEAFGEESVIAFDRWSEKFKDYIAAMGRTWTDDEKIARLKLALMDTPRDLFKQLTAADTNNVDNALVALRSKLDSPQRRELAKRTLTMCKQREDESIAQFVKRLTPLHTRHNNIDQREMNRDWNQQPRFNKSQNRGGKNNFRGNRGNWRSGEQQRRSERNWARQNQMTQNNSHSSPFQQHAPLNAVQQTPPSQLSIDVNDLVRAIAGLSTSHGPSDYGTPTKKLISPLGDGSGRTFSDWASGDMDDARIGQALLGLGEKLPVQGLTWDNLTQRHPALSSLCEGQQQTALYMMDPIRRLVFMQAPPGTGKTYCSATIAAAILSEDPDATVLCVAPLNIATARLCEEMQKALQKAGSEIPLLALFSGNGKYRYAVHLQKISKHLLATALSGPELQEALKDGPEKKKVSRYLEQCAANPRQTDEGTIAKIFLGIEKRRALFCTLSLGEQIAPIFQDFSHIILDEAGQAPYSQLLSFLSLFSSIKKVLVTGDKYQLHVNMMELPPAVHHGFGLDTAIINFDNSLSVDSTTLTTSFRSHPFITKCIEAGAYADKGEKIAAGRTEDEMTLFTKNNNFKLPVKDSPLLFMHITDQMEQEETSFSSTNPRQTDATIALLHTLVPHFQGTIRVVCLYAGQTADIAQRCNEESIEEVIVTTADSTQGYEADLTIVTIASGNRISVSIECN
ncbi:hypothetical protein niasHT_027422 [Heterodera trifolii]|uniref:DNA2/NAM7 helicase-like C-terminal domain-containing protein n=1 Tax=Heterodera trifolii TaxID=157864 RepID=A0ABD2JSA1_9BILA